MNHKTLTLIGICAVAVGSLLPWVTLSTGFLTLAKNGYEGDGIFTLIGSWIALIGAVTTPPRPGRRFHPGAALLCGLCAALGVYDLIGLSGGDPDIVISPGIGLIMVIAGGLIGLYGDFSKIEAPSISAG